MAKKRAGKAFYKSLRKWARKDLKKGGFSKLNTKLKRAKLQAQGNFISNVSEGLADTGKYIGGRIFFPKPTKLKRAWEFGTSAFGVGTLGYIGLHPNTRKKIKKFGKKLKRKRKRIGRK